MAAVELLKHQAIAKRNEAIRTAKVEYRIAMQEIKALSRKLKLRSRGRPRLAAYIRRAADIGDPNRGKPASVVVVEILREGVSVSLAELTLEVQRRGCRANDDPRDVAQTIRGTLYYYRDQINRGGDGRYSLRC
jgi:hypothetical protein